MTGEHLEETPAPHALPRLARRTAAADVQEMIRGRIESGAFPLDMRLPSEAELARTFGVSRPVVREALMSLQAMGYTRAQTGRGTFVISDRVSGDLVFGRYSPAQIREVRRSLEIPSAELAALRRTEKDIGVLASLLGRIEEAADPTRRNRLDVDFHIAIAAASGNPLFVMLIEDMRAILESHTLALTRVPHRREAAIDEHAQIYEAIVGRDARAAGLAMARHLDGAEEGFAYMEAGRPAPA